MRRSLCNLGRIAIVSLVLHIVAVELYRGIDCKESKKTKIDFSKVRKFVKPIFKKIKKYYGPSSKIVSTSRKFGSNVVKSFNSNTLKFLESFDEDNVFEETFKEADDLFAGFLDNFFKNSKENESDDQKCGDDQENGHDQQNEDDQEADEEPEGDTGGLFGHETSDSKKLLGAEQKHNNSLEKGQSSTFGVEHIKSEDLLSELKSKLKDSKEEVKNKSGHTKDELKTKVEHFKGSKPPIFGKPEDENEDTLSSLENNYKKLEEDLTSVKEKFENELSEMTGSSQKVSKDLLHESDKNEHSSNERDIAKSPKHSKSKHMLRGEKCTDQYSNKSEELFKDFENEQDRPAAGSSMNNKTKHNKKLNGSDEKTNLTNGSSESKQRRPITLSFLRDINVTLFAPFKVSNPKSRREPSNFRKWLHPQEPNPSYQDYKSQPTHQVNGPQDSQPSLHPPKQDEPKLTHQLQKSNSPISMKSLKKKEKHHTAHKENQIEDCGLDCEPIT